MTATRQQIVAEFVKYILEGSVQLKIQSLNSAPGPKVGHFFVVLYMNDMSTYYTMYFEKYFETTTNRPISTVAKCTFESDQKIWRHK